LRGTVVPLRVLFFRGTGLPLVLVPQSLRGSMGTVMPWSRGNEGNEIQCLRSGDEGTTFHFVTASTPECHRRAFVLVHAVSHMRPCLPAQWHLSFPGRVGFFTKAAAAVLLYCRRRNIILGLLRSVRWYLLPLVNNSEEDGHLLATLPPLGQTLQLFHRSDLLTCPRPSICQGICWLHCVHVLMHLAHNAKLPYADKLLTSSPPRRTTNTNLQHVDHAQGLTRQGAPVRGHK
jgi:hypothetical protein